MKLEKLEKKIQKLLKDPEAAVFAQLTDGYIALASTGEICESFGFAVGGEICVCNQKYPLISSGFPVGKRIVAACTDYKSAVIDNSGTLQPITKKSVDNGMSTCFFVNIGGMILIQFLSRNPRGFTRAVIPYSDFNMKFVQLIFLKEVAQQSKEHALQAAAYFDKSFELDLKELCDSNNEVMTTNDSESNTSLEQIPTNPSSLVEQAENTAEENYG